MDQFSAPTWDDLVTERLIGRRRRSRDVRTEVKKRTVKLKAEAGCDRFPTDVHVLARAVGIREVRNVPLAMRGRLVREGSGIVAELNEDLPLRMQRFVLAHEIAHILLARDISTSGASSIYGSAAPKRSYDYVERLCDFGAREILVPENAVLKELRRHPFSLDLLECIATEADCDPQLVAECICDLPGPWHEMVFLFCRLVGDKVEVTRTVPGGATKFELVNGTECIIHLSLQQKKMVKGIQEIWVNEKRGLVSAEAIALGAAEVMLLIDPQAFRRLS